jgi:hypothetical protein
MHSATTHVPLRVSSLAPASRAHIRCRHLHYRARLKLSIPPDKPPPASLSPPLASQMHTTTTALLLDVNPCPHRHLWKLRRATTTSARPTTLISFSVAFPPPIPRPTSLLSHPQCPLQLLGDPCSPKCCAAIRYNGYYLNPNLKIQVILIWDKHQVLFFI